MFVVKNVIGYSHRKLPHFSASSRLLWSLNLSHFVARQIQRRGGAAYLLSVAEIIACNDVSLFEAFLCPWTPPSTFYKLREIERAFLP
jgi:hypothetical protein